MSVVKIRGMLTQAVQEKAIEFIGREISELEIGLMLYVQTLLLNQKSLEINKVNAEERYILSLWQNQGFFEGNVNSPVSVSESFWKAMHEILWVGYVNFADKMSLPNTAKNSAKIGERSVKEIDVVIKRLREDIESVSKVGGVIDTDNDLQKMKGWLQALEQAKEGKSVGEEDVAVWLDGGWSEFADY